jgi:hypothetical protein
VLFRTNKKVHQLGKTNKHLTTLSLAETVHRALIGRMLNENSELKAVGNRNKT